MMTLVIRETVIDAHDAHGAHAAHAGDAGTTRPVAPGDVLVLPLHRRMVVQRLADEHGAEELHLFYGDQVITFDDPAQFAFAETLATTPRFDAHEASTWSRSLSWDVVRGLLEELCDAGILARASEATDGTAAIAAGQMVRPNPLPPSTCPFARTWKESEAITAELTGRAVEPGYLELFVPVFRVAHIALDADNRQVGEANVFPRALRLDRPTTWVTCAYGGTRYMNERPMNVTALKAMRLHWRQMMAVLRQVRAAYLRRVPGARAGWTIGYVERLAVSVLAVPTYQLVKADGVDVLHPALSSVFRVTDGLRMAMHQMLFVPIGEPARSPDERVTPELIFEYAERNYSFHSEHGVCAGPKHMVQEFLRTLLTGEGEPSDPFVFDAPVAAALADMDAALDYGFLGLRAHAAFFSLWPTLTRTYEEVAAATSDALAAGHNGLTEMRDHFARVVRTMKSGTYLATEDWRQHRETVYADMFAACGRQLSTPATDLDLAAELAPAPSADQAVFAAALADALAHRFRRGAADDQALAALTGSLTTFAVKAQAIFQTAVAVQAHINTLLGRSAPTRPFGTSEADVHVLLQGTADRRLPSLVDDLRTLLDLDVSVDSRHLALVDRLTASTTMHDPTGMSPVEHHAHSRVQGPNMKIKSNIRAGKGGASGVGKNSNSSTPEVEVVDPAPVYVPPVSRCLGA